MLGHGATGQFAIGQVGAGTAETITPDKWFIALSEPPRFRLGLKAGLQQFEAPPDAFPFVSFSWFDELSKPPVLTKLGLKASEQQFLSFHPAPSPFVATGWFAPLSEPVRFKPGLKAALQQFFAADTTVIPTTKLMEWFGWLSEPVRFKLGLAAARQQFLATPSQLRPTPTSFGVLDAIETKDTFLGAARTFNQVSAAEVGIIGPAPPVAEIAIGIPTVAGARIAITIL